MLYHLTGVEHALLFRMNDNLDLGFKPNKVNLDNITSKLHEKKQLLTEFNDAAKGINWLYCVKKLRNIGTHRSFFNVKVARSPEGHGDERIPDRVSLKVVPNLDVISYLSECIQKMKQLIHSIMEKEPILGKLQSNSKLDGISIYYYWIRS